MTTKERITMTRLYMPLAVVSIDWLDPRVKRSLVVLIEAFTRNRLATTTRTRFKIATELMKSATRNTAIVALRGIQIIFALAVANPTIFL